MAGTTAAQQGREVRQRLLTAAAELIGEVGWTAVSTRRLAERAQVRPGLVHYHFASLQALLRDAAMDTIHSALGALPVPPATGATELVDHMVAAIDDFPQRGSASLVITESYLMATRDEELRRRLAEVIARLRQDLAARLTATGIPSPDGTAATVLAALDGFLLHKALVPDLSAALIGPAIRRLTTTNHEGDTT